jgi:hypothetical protein
MIFIKIKKSINQII